MATYKLIQNVEAEDHILGPLTLRQFIFALISIFFFYLCFLLFAKHAPFLIPIFLLPALFFGFFALPFGHDQPTEIWALAKIRYFLKPRTRVWNQSGVKELVKITAPKKLEKLTTTNLSNFEVQNRLKTLANTMDSRGWVIKNAQFESPILSSGDQTDRLVSVDILPNPMVEAVEPQDADIFEPTSSVSNKLGNLIEQSEETHKKSLMDQLNSNHPDINSQSTGNNQWFMPRVDNNPLPPVYSDNVDASNENIEDKALLNQIKLAKQNEITYTSHIRTIQPLNAQPKTPPQSQKHLANIQSLAGQNNLTIQTISHEAKKLDTKSDEGDEVIVPLR